MVVRRKKMVISGPPGSGKSTVASNILNHAMGHQFGLANTASAPQRVARDVVYGATGTFAVEAPSLRLQQCPALVEGGEPPPKTPSLVDPKTAEWVDFTWNTDPFRLDADPGEALYTDGTLKT